MKKSALKQLIREAIEEVKPKVEEEVLTEEFSPETDEIGAFWITEMPTLSSTIKDIVFECKDIAYFANQVKGGLSVNDIAGVFKNEAKAKKLGEKLLAERDKKKNEAKKAGEAYKKMKEEALAKVQEYMKNKKATKQVVDELNDVTK
jgi:hypothetical protein